MAFQGVSKGAQACGVQILGGHEAVEAMEIAMEAMEIHTRCCPHDS